MMMIITIIYDKMMIIIRSVCKFDPNCICVFGCQTLGNIVFEVLETFPFQKWQELRMLSTVTLSQIKNPCSL